AVMQALVRSVGQDIPVGEVVFFRSAVAVVPVVAIYALRGELAAAIHTKRPLGHVGRGLVGLGGMFFNFASLARLPLAEVAAISFAAPLVTLPLPAVMLTAPFRIPRGSGLGIGFAGVTVMLAPHLHAARLAEQPPAQTRGAALALAAAFCNAGAVIQTRRLTDSETTSSIVLY